MELRHLKYAIAVAEERNFTRAASRLRVAQPPLSHQIKQLEEELGVQLFQRGKRFTKPTPAGVIFCEQARALLAKANELKEHTRRASRGKLGRLAIGYVAALSTAFLPRTLRRLRSLYPAIEIQLSDLSDVAQTEALLAGKLDIGFMTLAPEHADAELSSQCFRRDQLGILLWKGHPLSNRAKLALKDLKNERLVVIAPQVSPNGYALLMNLFTQTGLRIDNMIEAHDGQAVIDLVSAGFGVAVAPSILQQRIGAEAIFRPATPTLPAIGLHCFWLQKNPSPVLKRFLEMIQAEVEPSLRRQRK